MRKRTAATHLLWPALLAGCLAPRGDAPTGSAEEFGRMLAGAGAEPVVGTERDGPVDLSELVETDLDEAAAAELLVEQPFEEIEYEESPYIRFGERIIVRELDGVTFVTKPYTLPPGRPLKIKQLLDALAPFPSRERPAAGADGSLPPLDVAQVEYQILAGFDAEYFTNFASFDTSFTAPKEVPLSDVLIVTAVPDLLEEFEDFLDLFAGGGVPQIELEAKIIEISETDSKDIGVQMGEYLFGSSNFVNALNVNLPNFSESTEALLSLGAIQDDSQFSGIVEAIQEWQNVSVEARPKTVVRSGGVARIETTTKIPYLSVKSLSSNGTFQLAVDYQEVGTQLWISPRRVGSSTLALDVWLQGSQQLGSQVLVVNETANSSTPIEVPIVAVRTAKTVVHLQPGQTLVIGGLTQERDQEIVSKVPILGDIPLLGLLFRSTFTVKDRQHVIFAISPRIIQRSDFESDL